MIAYLKRDDRDTDDEAPAPKKPIQPRHALARDMLHGLSPEEFDVEAKSLAAAEALTPQVRERLRTQLVERLKTPIDPPSWGPDWIKRGSKSSPLTEKKEGGFRLASLFPFGRKEEEEDEDDADVRETLHALDEDDQDDAQIIAHNMEKSRQVYHFRSLYVLAAVAAIGIALLAMFVDYQIIKGDVWTRALANEFMVVPASLQSTLLFKSLQVVFAVLIIHFMLKITGVYGRNTMVAVAFVLALVMIGGLGYLVAYNNMTGGTSTTLEHAQENGQHNNSIDQLFASLGKPASVGEANADASGRVIPAAMSMSRNDELSLSIPKPSERSLANADHWFWLAFASVIFFIVTTVAALYMQTFENNIRNFLISRDYLHRKKQFAQLHLLELAERDAG
ncbi:MAG TPA: hypothetical protein VMU22_04380 [Rhizomicrobium sp.]|nr:hypothetical protein [Rhizomicrobium sp.]